MCVCYLPLLTFGRCSFVYIFMASLPIDEHRHLAGPFGGHKGAIGKIQEVLQMSHFLKRRQRRQRRQRQSQSLLMLEEYPAKPLGMFLKPCKKWEFNYIQYQLVQDFLNCMISMLANIVKQLKYINLFQQLP